MERITRVRAGFVLLVFLLVLGFFSLTLYDLQIIQTGGKTDNISTFTTLTRVKAARGNILDRNGKVLVSNRASFDLAINHYVLISADGTNEYLYDLVKRCEALDIDYTEHFPISKERPFIYTLDTYNSSWQSYFQKYLAYMGSIDSDITAPLLVETLRKKYKIPETWTDDEARQVIGLRYELDLRRCINSLSKYIFLEDASDEAKAAIMELNIPGLDVEFSVVREYHTEYAAHILGHVGAVTKDQWDYYKNIEGYELDSRVGQSGIEEAFEQYLHGVDGWREDTVAKDGTLISSRYLTLPKAGSNVEITIDITLQGIAEDKMADVIEALRSGTGDGSDAEGGAVVAIEPTTGQVLVCASYPTFDLANYAKKYDEIKDAPYAPLYNRALQGIYPPGSTYKMSMLIAALDSSSEYTSETVIRDKGAFTKYAGFIAKCLKWSSDKETHGDLNGAEALKVSCNYFFYELADNISITAMDETAKGLGLGVKTGIELFEAPGYRANPETKALLHKGEDAIWYQGNKIHASIGQDDNRFTPIQLCAYTSALANRGTRYKATFLKRVVAADFSSLLLESKTEIAGHLSISDDAYASYLDGMKKVTSESGGTAYGTFKNYPITVAAKTGTAQTGTTGSDNGAFVCFAPAEAPKIAISIYGEKAGHGSTLSKIAKAMLDNYFEIGTVGDVNIYENQLN